MIILDIAMQQTLPLTINENRRDTKMKLSFMSLYYPPKRLEQVSVYAFTFYTVLYLNLIGYVR